MQIAGGCMRISISRKYGGIAAGAVIALAVTLLVLKPGTDFWQAWLAAITTVTFAAFGYDKATAVKRVMRVPEQVLIGLAVAGGTPGAVAGMFVFHHKTAKAVFQASLRKVALVQAVLFLLYWIIVDTNIVGSLT